MEPTSTPTAHGAQAEAARAPQGWWDDDRLLAYVVLEQARGVAEAQLSSGWQRDVAAVDVHRELGMAGYLASEEMEPQLREGLLELVHAHGPVSVPPAEDEWESVLAFARSFPGRSAHRRATATSCSRIATSGGRSRPWPGCSAAPGRRAWRVTSAPPGC